MRCSFAIAPTMSILSAFSAAGQTTTIPTRTEQNVIVASYNIKWMGDTPHDFTKLASVIQHFDVCGILEVKKETAVADLAKALKEKTGKDWGFVHGVRTHRPQGLYHEAYAAVYRRDRVQLGDGVVSNVWDLEEAFRNDPFLVSFRRGNFDFLLMLVHTRWSDDEEGTREKEVAKTAEQILWMKSFLSERDFLLAGDFNYAGTAEAMEAMAETADLVQLDANPKTTFKADLSGYSSSYDHIFVLDGQTPEFVAGSCQAMDVTAVIYGSNSIENMGKSKNELSDHLPIWAEFRTDMTDTD